MNIKNTRIKKIPLNGCSIVIRSVQHTAIYRYTLFVLLDLKKSFDYGDVARCYLINVFLN